MKPLTTCQRVMLRWIRSFDREATITQDGCIHYTLTGHKRGFVDTIVYVQGKRRVFQRPGYISESKVMTPSEIIRVYAELQV